MRDPFVGIMKGVILSIAPDVRLVDITHDIPSHDIQEAAFILDTAYRYFPTDTIHIAVVDPGVGGARRPLAAAVGGHIFIGPDNGILSHVLHTEPTFPIPAAYHITNSSLFHLPVSRTFHGRDVFAPVAAHLVRGTPLESVGPRVVNFLRKAPPRPRDAGESRFVATILRVDKFGNLITNLLKHDLKSDFAIRIAGLEIRRLLSHYDEAQPGEFFAIEGSAGYIELSVRQGSAAERLSIGRGAEIEVETEGPNQ